MNSQQLQSWANTHPSQPAGWQGQWPPRAPPGPPPAPQGVDPSRWFGGQWHFNPMFQTVAPQSVQTTAWAPHPSWGQISYPAGFNPWTTAPPKQEQGRSHYWDVELSDNPLRLEGMDHCTEQPTFGPPRPQEEAPRTPWVWAPKELSESESPERQRKDSEPSVRRSSEDKTRPSIPSSAPLSSTRQAANGDSSRAPYNNIYSHSAAAPLVSQNGQRDTPVRPNRLPEPPIIPPQLPAEEASRILATRRSNEFRHRSHSRDVERARESRHASATSTNEPRRSVDQKSDDRSAFSTSQQLQPTFSPKIVRTLNHYVSTTVSSASAAAAAAAANKTPASIISSTVRTPASVRRPTRDDDETPSPPRPNAHTHGPIYGPVTPLRPDLTGSSTSYTPSRQSTAPSSVFSTSTALTSPMQGSFTDEPEVLLSPILSATLLRGEDGLSRSRTSPNIGSEDPSPSRELSRSHTFPLVSNNVGRPIGFSPIPEERERVTPSNESSVSKQRTPRPSAPQVTSQADRSRGTTREKHSPSYMNTHSREPSTSYTPSRTRDPSPMMSSASAAAAKDRSSSHHSSSTSPYRYNTDPAPPIRKSSSAESGRSVTRSHTYPSLEGSSSSYPGRTVHSPIPSPSRAHSHSRHTSPIRGGYPHNPLPQPPELVASVSSYLNSLSSASAAASQAQSRSHSRRPSQSPSSATILTRSQTQPVIGSSHMSSNYPTTQPVTPTYPSTSQASNAASQPSTYSTTAYSSSRSTQHTSSQPQPQPRSRSQSQSQPQPAPTPTYTSTTHVTPSSRLPHTHSLSYASQPRSSSQHPPQAPYSSASQAANASLRTRESSPNPPRVEPPPPPPRPLRLGFWNRRGDHLWVSESSLRNGSPRTSEMYIVYAPRAKANPPELSDYPAATEGFKNHEGKMIKYNPNIPELPESLPRHGEEPLRPYDWFVRYYP